MKLSMLICWCTFQIALSQQVVYPLHIEDMWEYGPSGRERIVGDTLTSDGRRYFILRYYNPQGLITQLPDDYVRQEGNKVFYRSRFDSSEFVALDFGLSPGDTVWVTPHGYTKIFRGTKV